MMENINKRKSGLVSSFDASLYSPNKLQWEISGGHV